LDPFAEEPERAPIAPPVAGVPVVGKRIEAAETDYCRVVPERCKPADPRTKHNTRDEWEPLPLRAK